LILFIIFIRKVILELRRCLKQSWKYRFVPCGDHVVGLIVMMGESGF
jgi:hypothetical protein